MITYIVARMAGEMKRRYTSLASIAFVVSLIVHGVLIYYISGLHFQIARAPARQTQESLHTLGPLKLVDVKPEPPPVQSPRTVAVNGGGVAGGVEPADLSKEAEAMAMPPDKVAIEPPPLTGVDLAGEKKGLAEPVPGSDRPAWDARQEIITVEKRVVGDGDANHRRANIPSVERVAAAPDVVLPVDISKLAAGGSPTGTEAGAGELAKSEINQKPMGGVVSDNPEMLIGRPGRGGVVGGKGTGTGSGTGPGSGLYEEVASNVTPYKAIENLLAADVYVYKPAFESKNTYVRIEIRRAGADLLPVIAKDVLLVQDSSNSMADQRLHFCKEGLPQCLAEIGPQDRFNIIRFREKAELCFGDWVENKKENLEQAMKFISEMQSQGNTDILESVKDLLNLSRIPGRPVVALVVTDGRSTIGTTDSSEIIGQFSKVNDGAISLFTLGTIQTADSYLLDLLSYCNRGESVIVTTGRWDIPAVMQKFMREFSRPILSEVRFRFGRSSECEAYPVLTSNLYLDRPLVLYGRMARDSKKIVFQAVGKAGEVNCDMVFDLELDKVAKSGDSSIRENWAKQKIYSLIGEQARKGGRDLVDVIDDTAKLYKIKIPYKGRF